MLFQGQNLDRACRELDVVVRIGSSFCNVTSLSRQQLTCRPPVEQPPVLADGMNVAGDENLPQVVVGLINDIQLQLTSACLFHHVLFN